MSCIPFRISVIRTMVGTAVTIEADDVSSADPLKAAKAQ